jgi:hypothetical protein
MPDEVSAGRRVLRRISLGTGPLKRGSDRVEFASRLLCAVVLLLACPVALTVGVVTGADAAQVAQQQASARHQQVAVLLEVAPGIGRTETGTPSVRVRATWSAPDGGRRIGVVWALRTAPAGARVRIWVDTHGELTDRPLDTAGVVTTGLLGGLLTFLGLAAIALAGHLAACRALWHQRTRQWEREWRYVEPLWTGR